MNSYLFAQILLGLLDMDEDVMEALLDWMEEIGRNDFLKWYEKKNI
jgi:hypothetical protein